MHLSSPSAPVDTWSDFLRDARYVVRGGTAHEVHRSVLQLAHTAAERGEVCLFASAAAPAELVHLADGIGFDMSAAARAGTFRLLRTPSALLGDGLTDALRARGLAHLTAQVRTHRPALFVLDDLAALARFEEPEAYSEALGALRDGLATDGIPLVLSLIGDGAPAVGKRVQAERPPPPSHGDGAPVPSAASEVGIAFLDLHTSAPPRLDPFATDAAAGRDLNHGHFVATDLRAYPDAFVPHHASAFDPPVLEPGAAPRIASGAAAILDTDLFESLDIESAFDALDLPPAPEAPALPAQLPSPRHAFVRAYDEAAATHEVAGRPFLAVALRMPPDHPAARRFHFVLRALEQTLGERDVLLGDEERCRAVWLMPDAAPEAASPVFEALKCFLRDATSEADHILQTASAALVPNGCPFEDAAALLAHFFDGA